MANKGPQIFDISKFNLEQLTGLKNRLDQELQFFSESLQQLKMAQMKFSESGSCVEKLTPDKEGAEILVPLTSCMYVPGKIVEINKLLLNVGTGYYIEKDSSGAVSYFQRKVKYLTEQMEKIQKIATDKTKLREVVMDMMEVKVNDQLSMLQKQEALQAPGVKA